MFKNRLIYDPILYLSFGYLWYSSILTGIIGIALCLLTIKIAKEKFLGTPMDEGDLVVGARYRIFTTSPQSYYFILFERIPGKNETKIRFFWLLSLRDFLYLKDVTAEQEDDFEISRDEKGNIHYTYYPCGIMSGKKPLK